MLKSTLSNKNDGGEIAKIAFLRRRVIYQSALPMIFTDFLLTA